jgi:acyl transferase domain-containing protein
VLMEPMLDDYAAVAESLSYEVPAIPVLSTLTGLAQTDLGAAYWVRQARATVRFADAVGAARGLGIGHFLELSPDAVLTPHIHAVADSGPAGDAGPAVVAALRARHAEPAALFHALAALFAAGIGVDWRAMQADTAHPHLELPTYPFQRQRYWAPALDVGGRPAATLIPAIPADPADPALDTVADLRSQLTGLPDDERHHVLLEQVRIHVAAVLGHPSQSAVEPDQAFQDLGFDSVAAVELHKRLSLATGLALPATLVYDQPSSRDVAAHIAAALASGEDGAAVPVLAELDQLEAALARHSPVQGSHDPVTIRLEALLRQWRDSGTQEEAEEAGSMDEATDEQLFDVLNRELGIA